MIKTQKMTSIFKTSIFPEQQKAKDEWLALTDETHYDLPLWRLRLILTEIGMNPTKLDSLTQFVSKMVESTNRSESLSCIQVMEVAACLEAIFKYPEQTKALLFEISSTEVWATQIAVSLAKD